VIAVGDGRVGDDVKLMWPAVGDIILIQMNPMLSKQMSQRVHDIPVFVVHQNDCIARIHNRTVNYENFQPLGRWVFVKVDFEKMAGRIELPRPDYIYGGAADTLFYFESAGVGASHFGFKKGQQIYCDKTRVNVLKLANAGGGPLGDYGYIDRDSVVGEAILVS